MEFLESGRERAERRWVEVEGWRIEYACGGEGRNKNGEGGDGKGERRRALVCFHGFARPLEDMLPWGEVWGEERMVISIHLPEHGGSRDVSPGAQGREWGGERAIAPELWAVIARRIADVEGAAAGPMDLLGYSIGGRVALAALVSAPEAWGRVVLLAPDGLRKSPFYTVTVHTQVGRWAWRAIDRRAERMLRTLDRWHRWGLLTKHLHGFAHFHLATAEMRRMVWKGWRVHRDCWPSLGAVARVMRAHRAPVDLCFGQHDRVIPPGNGRRLAQRLKGVGHVHFHRVPAGHNLQRPDVMKAVVERIFQQ